MKNLYTAIHSINTRNNYCLYRQTTNLSFFWKGMYYADVKIFKRLPCTLTGLFKKGTQFKFKFNTTFHCTKLNVELKSKQYCAMFYVSFS